MSKAQLEILLPADEPDQGRTLDLLESADAEGLAEHLEAMSLSDALREILNLSAIDRESVLALLPVELAASLIGSTYRNRR